ncbi:excitatory amino acid transporter 1-like isoform X2 [Centropristis striata]|uniref:excitatory amino acid transporter 1-like isoform X2 n=1 Tax=Centropristis striata TaxID=184440 RepID=UPI0027E1511B|nr:excitatory amino acid transporter 1-like isoform X2 [Centropristis striata]
MKAVLPSPDGLSELDSVEVTELQDNKTFQKCNEPSAHGSLSLNGANVMAYLKRNAFVLLTMAAVAFGIGLGFALRQIDMSARNVKYLAFPGELLLRMLQMLVLPLIVSSVIAGTSSVNRKYYGKIGLRAFSYYIVTTIIAGFTGIALAVIIQPGKSSRKASVPSSGNAEAVQPVDSFLDLIRNMIPSNLVEASFRKYKSAYSTSLGVINVTNENEDREPVPGTLDGINILGLLCFSVAFGLVLGIMDTEAKPLRDFFDSLNKVIMYLVNMVIWYSPVGILFLLAGQIMKITDIGETVTRRNPFRFMLGLLQVLTTAFGTSSSSATLPVTIHCMEENHNMDMQVTLFMLPIGATMNMDGAALYEAIAVLFIAQVNNMEFNFGQMIILSLVVTAASTGAAGIPHAGMATMLIVLESVGLPTEDISLLLMVDWIMDRLRTTVNVLGDCIGVSVVQHLSRHELRRSNPAETSLVEENIHI